MTGWLVAVEGPSGAGKSRTVREAARRLVGVALPEAYDRIRPRPSLTWTTDTQLLRLEERLLREDACRYQEGRRLADTGAIVLADTGFLGPLTYTAGLVRHGLASPPTLGKLVRTGRAWHDEGRWSLPDAVLYVRTPASERRRRAGGDPRGHPPRLQARHQLIAEDEQRFYRTVVAPQFGARFRFVSGSGPPEVVVRHLVHALARSRAPARRPSLGRVLRAIERPPCVS